MKKIIVKLAGLAGAIVIVAVLGICVIFNSNSTDGKEQKNEGRKNNNIHEKTVYNTNKKGETYGKQDYNSEEEPDLLAVTATNGKRGYIRQTDIDKYAGGEVNSPDEAMEYEKNNKNIIKIPVYTKEGDEVIGYYELSETSEDVKMDAGRELQNENLIALSSSDSAKNCD